MNCPLCSHESSILQEMEWQGATLRRRNCVCGARWTTKETTVKGTLTEVTTEFKLGGNGSLNAVKSEFKLNGGTVRGSGSSPVISAPDPPGDSSKELISRALNRKGRGDAKPYEPEFEKLWAACKGRRGNKRPAFKVWERLKPDTTLTVVKYNEMLASLEPWRTAKDFSTWLNARGWEDEYKPYVAPPADGKSAAPVSWRERERQSQEDRALEARADAVFGGRR